MWGRFTFNKRVTFKEFIDAINHARLSDSTRLSIVKKYIEENRYHPENLAAPINLNDDDNAANDLSIPVNSDTALILALKKYRVTFKPVYISISNCLLDAMCHVQNIEKSHRDRNFAPYTAMCQAQDIEKKNVNGETAEEVARLSAGLSHVASGIKNRLETLTGLSRCWQIYYNRYGIANDISAIAHQRQNILTVAHQDKFAVANGCPRTDAFTIWPGSPEEFIAAVARGRKFDLAIVRMYIAANRQNVANINNPVLSLEQAVLLEKRELSGLPALHIAALSGNHSILIALLRVPGIDVSVVNKFGDTVLMRAARNGNTPVVKLLLKNITNINDLERSRVGSPEQTAMRFATTARHLDIADLIRARIHELTPRNNSNNLPANPLPVGLPPLNAEEKNSVPAPRISHEEFIQAAQEPNDAGLTIVESYIETNRQNVADINKKDPETDDTALIHAVRVRNRLIVKALLTVDNLNITAAGSNKETALIVAVQQCTRPIVSLLLAKITSSKDLQHVNEKGHTAEYIAAIINSDLNIAASIRTRTDELEKQEEEQIKERIEEFKQLKKENPEAAKLEKEKLKKVLSYSQRIAMLEDEGYTVDIPENLKCPISKYIMDDPILIASGHAYDRKELRKWFLQAKTCPQTRFVIDPSQLFNSTCVILRDTIRSFVEEQEKLAAKAAKEKGLPASRIEIANYRYEFFKGKTGLINATGNEVIELHTITPSSSSS